MKRDAIEDRLAGIEHDLRAFKSEHRQDMESMKSDLRKFQEIMIEERIGSIRDELYRGYNDIAIESMISKAGSSLDERLPDPCWRKMRSKCVNVFTGHIRSAAESVGYAEDGDTCVASIAGGDEKAFAGLKGTKCQACYDIYKDERDDVIAVVNRLAGYRDSLGRIKKETYMADLPDDLVISQIIDPLSHKARFRMLRSLSSGSMSYSELSSVTGYEGGHLIYHMNKLTSAGLVLKDDGKYVITEKGLGVMEIVRKMFSE